MTDISARTMTRVSSQVGLPAADDWRDRAYCRDRASASHDPWFPVGGQSKDRSTRDKAYELARRICRMCPALDECLEDALAMGEREGMRGGMDPAELRALGPGHRGSLLAISLHKRAHQRPCVECRNFTNKRSRERTAKAAAELRARKAELRRLNKLAS